VQYSLLFQSKTQNDEYHRFVTNPAYESLQTIRHFYWLHMSLLCKNIHLSFKKIESFHFSSTRSLLYITFNNKQNSITKPNSSLEWRGENKTVIGRTCLQKHLFRPV
jgi:hypothetical protein